MTATNQSVSIRLEPHTKAALDDAAKRTKRSRSFLMQEALEKYLVEITKQQEVQSSKPPLSQILELAKRSAKPIYVRTGGQVQADLRWLRDNE